MASSFTPTATFPLPTHPNVIYTNLWADNNTDTTTTTTSDTAAFDKGINGRDNGACIVCGFDDPEGLKHCHIIPRSEPSTWEFMRGLGYIPTNAKSVAHESRNGVLMCATHHDAFHRYRFYIRWDYERNKFIVVNHSRLQAFEMFHGKALHFDAHSKRCPFPTAFLWHEYRVRGFHPTHGDRPFTFKEGGLQGGGSYYGGRDGVGDDDDDDGDGTGRSDGGGRDPGISSTRVVEQVGGRDSDADAGAYVGDDTTVFTPMRLEGNHLAAWLVAAQQHSSWRDCLMENLSWDGTAEENVEKYQREVGILD